jgi:hypothetical protein
LRNISYLFQKEYYRKYEHKFLTALGNHNNQRILTRRQVRVIEEFIGEAV